MGDSGSSGMAVFESQSSTKESTDFEFVLRRLWSRKGWLSEELRESPRELARLYDDVMDSPRLGRPRMGLRLRFSRDEEEEVLERSLTPESFGLGVSWEEKLASFGLVASVDEEVVCFGLFASLVEKLECFWTRSVDVSPTLFTLRREDVAEAEVFGACRWHSMQASLMPLASASIWVSILVRSLLKSSWRRERVEREVSKRIIDWNTR